MGGGKKLDEEDRIGCRGKTAEKPMFAGSIV